VLSQKRTILGYKASAPRADRSIKLCALAAVVVLTALVRSCYLPPAPAPMILTGRTNVERMRHPSSDVWSDIYRA
jgi:hypothetical protein